MYLIFPKPARTFINQSIISCGRMKTLNFPRPRHSWHCILATAVNIYLFSLYWEHPSSLRSYIPHNAIVHMDMQCIAVKTIYTPINILNFLCRFSPISVLAICTHFDAICAHFDLQKFSSYFDHSNCIIRRNI